MYEQISSNIWRSRFLILVVFLIIGAFGYVSYKVTGNPITIVIAAGVAVFMTVGSYYYSDQIVLATMSAQVADKNVFAHYINSVEGIAIAAGIPTPRAYIVNDPAPNAFATGRDPEHAVICVTTGLLDMMDRTELEGVIAHEMSHIKNFDIRFMTLVAVLVGAITLMADWFWWTGRFGGFSGGDDDDNGSSNTIFFIIGIVLAILAPISAALVQAAISRQREFLADSTGALLTRYPDGLANALEKISMNPLQLRHANKATAHMFIENPLKDYGGTINSLFDTHPPALERIKRLRSM